MRYSTGLSWAYIWGRLRGCGNRFAQHRCQKDAHENQIYFKWQRVLLHLKLKELRYFHKYILLLCIFRGNTIAFTVNYFNTSEKFLPFEKFTVTLIPADRSRLPQSLTTNMDEVYYPRLDCSLENITDHIEQVLLGCYNLVSGQYTIRVNVVHTRM